VTVTYQGQPSLTLYTDGKRWEEEMPGAGEVEFKAEWKSEEFRVERKFEGGARLKETYKLTDEGRMEVSTELSGGPMPRTLRFTRIYDRADS